MPASASSAAVAGSAPSGQGCVIGDLLGLSRQAFLDGHFARQPWRAQAIAAAALEGLPSVADLSGLLPLLTDRPGTVQVSRDGDTFPAPLMADGRLDLQALWSQYYDGSSIVVNSIHTLDAGVRRLCDRLFFALGHNVQANAYLTPPNSRAFSTHYDTHDVIAIQLFGSKRWRLYEPPGSVPPLPGRASPKIDPDALETGTMSELELERGSALYIPRGRPHKVFATDQPSFHITFGLNAVSNADALRIALDMLEASDPEFRRHVSVDLFQAPGPALDLQSLGRRFAEGMGAPDLAARTVQALRKQGLRNAAIPPASLVLGPDAWVRWRRDHFCDLQALPDGSVVLSNGLKATLLSGPEIDLVQRLRAGAALRPFGADGPEDAAMIATLHRLAALGLLETGEAGPDG